ncbi:hypothetical protein AAW51_0036 [Caldimonas brevitalea]|uniref:Uncharacterized protein n=1 Tax=Caldimonas brevitalea TaxID=413882 RepID=A0A0G3BBN9_9BURK|nr:hypothetical protein AAW51_0036 [Caldimonas brevitalea]
MMLPPGHDLLHLLEWQAGVLMRASARLEATTADQRE